MSYVYETQKKNLFNPEGMKLFAGIRDQVRKLLELAGAVDMAHAMRLPEGVGGADSWQMMACVDMLVENGELQEVPQEGDIPGQHRLFRAGSKWWS